MQIELDLKKKMTNYQKQLAELAAIWFIVGVVTTLLILGIVYAP